VQSKFIFGNLQKWKTFFEISAAWMTIPDVWISDNQEFTLSLYNFIETLNKTW
jgi:hypothetical protein